MVRDVCWLKNKYLRIGVLVILPLCVYLIPKEWIFSEGNTICLFKNITGNACYGCGITRAMVSLMYFDFLAAWHYHWAVSIVAPIMCYLWLKMIYQIARKKK